MTISPGSSVDSATKTRKPRRGSWRTISAAVAGTLVIALGALFLSPTGHRVLAAAGVIQEQQWPQGIDKSDLDQLSHHGWSITETPNASSDGQSEAEKEAVAHFSSMVNESQVTSVTRATVQNTFRQDEPRDAWVVMLKDVTTPSYAGGDPSVGPMVIFIGADKYDFFGAISY